MKSIESRNRCLNGPSNIYIYIFRTYIPVNSLIDPLNDDHRVEAGLGNKKNSVADHLARRTRSGEIGCVRRFERETTTRTIAYKLAA